VKAEMKKILTEIQEGTFAREFIADCEQGSKDLLAQRAASKAHGIEQVGAKLRGLMSWLKPNKPSDTAGSPLES
jgi:ketol-acid reductoisomerase